MEAHGGLAFVALRPSFHHPPAYRSVESFVLLDSCRDGSTRVASGRRGRSHSAYSHAGANAGCAGHSWDAAVNSHFCQRASHCRQMRRSLFHDAFGSTQDTPQEKNPAHRLVRNLLSVLEHTERLPVVMHERYACNLRL